MTKIHNLRIAYTIAALAGITGLQADELPARNQDTDAHQELAEYVVVANTYEVPLSEVGSTVELITREDLELGQTTFVLDALRELPGVYLRNNGGPGSSFGITTRGLTDQPIVLIDGIEVSNPSDGQSINPGMLFSNSIDRVEFLKGSQSSLYGADAFAGVINITSREALDGEKNGSLSAGYGTYNTRQVNADFQMKEGPFDFSISANRYDSDGFSAQDQNSEDDAYRNTSATARVGYQLTEALKVYALGYHIDAKSDTDTSPTDTFGYSTSKQTFAKTGAVLQATDIWETQASVAYSKVENTSVVKDYLGDINSYPSAGDRYKVDWRNVISPIDQLDIAAGIEYEKEDNRSGPGDRNTSSYYVDNTVKPIDNLFWTIGGRYDDNSNYQDKSTWRTSISYLIEPIQSRLHGYYGTSFKAPSFYETTNPQYGNPGLSPEKGEGWDLGIETNLLHKDVTLDVTYFHNNIDDQIIFIATQFVPTFEGTFINNASYESDGVEVTLDWQADETLLFRANYTYTNAKNGDGSDPLHVPMHTANLSATWSTLNDALDLKASVRYIDERATYGGNSVGASTVVDLAGQYAINETLSLWTSINNLFDKDYQEYYGYNTPGFNITAGIRIDF